MKLLLLIAAIVCAAVASCAAFGWFSVDANYNGWLALSLVFGWASLLPLPAYFR